MPPIQLVVLSSLRRERQLCPAATIHTLLRYGADPRLLPPIMHMYRCDVHQQNCAFGFIRSFLDARGPVQLNAQQQQQQQQQQQSTNSQGPNSDLDQILDFVLQHMADPVPAFNLLMEAGYPRGGTPSNSVLRHPLYRALHVLVQERKDSSNQRRIGKLERCITSLLDRYRDDSRNKRNNDPVMDSVLSFPCLDRYYTLGDDNDTITKLVNPEKNPDLFRSIDDGDDAIAVARVAALRECDEHPYSDELVTYAWAEKAGRPPKLPSCGHSTRGCAANCLRPSGRTLADLPSAGGWRMG